MKKHDLNRLLLSMPALGLVLAGILQLGGCSPQGDVPEETSSGESSEVGTTSGEPFQVEDCSRMNTQAECEPVGAGDVTQGACRWSDVLIPGRSCADAVVVSQCIGMTYVGQGCQPFACDGSSNVDGFFREVDGKIEVFANPPSACGLVAIHDGWATCLGSDIAECSCLCST